MKRYKVKEILKMLIRDGWYLKNKEGSHRQFVHPVKKGKVTINGKPNDTIDQNNIYSIFKQAGWH